MIAKTLNCKIQKIARRFQKNTCIVNSLQGGDRQGQQAMLAFPKNALGEEG
jgi:hypothetical protein